MPKGLNSVLNTFVRSQLKSRECLASGTINAGDLVYSTGSYVASITNSTGGSKFVGVSLDATPITVAVGQDGSTITENPSPNVITVLTEGEFLFTEGVGADSLLPFTLVYALSAQRVTTTSTSNGSSIGTVATDQTAAGIDFHNGTYVTSSTSGNSVVVHIIPVTQ